MPTWFNLLIIQTELYKHPQRFNGDLLYFQLHFFYIKWNFFILCGNPRKNFNNFPTNENKKSHLLEFTWHCSGYSQKYVRPFFKGSNAQQQHTRGSGHEMDKLQRRLAYLYKPPVQGKFTILLLLLFGFVMTVDYVY